MLLIPRDRVTLRGWLAGYHLLAGGAGMLIVLLTAPAWIAQVDPAVQVQVRLLVLAMFAVFSVVFYAGILIAMRSTWAVHVATFVQCAQIPLFCIGVYRWELFAGAYVTPYWQQGVGLTGALGLKANLQLSWGNTTIPTYIGINLVPFVILWMLRHRLAVATAPGDGEPMEGASRSLESA